MPKVNPSRLQRVERDVAHRIKEEREARGWSYAKLAEEMTKQGCPIDPSAVHKTEADKYARRITVEEFVAYVRVFGGSTLKWLMPDNERAEVEFDSLVRDGTALHREITELRLQLAERELAYGDTIRAAAERLTHFEPEQREDAFAVHRELAEGKDEHYEAVLDEFEKEEG